MADVLALLESFEQVCADPYRTAREAAANGRPCAGYMCTYTPEELLHAAGYLPVRVLGRNAGATPQADAHLPAYSCGFIRTALDMALSGELDFMDLMMFSHTCDTMQNIADIWERAVPKMKTVTLTTPVQVTGEPAVRYFCGEIDYARMALQRIIGRDITHDDIRKSITLYNDHRDAMRRLYDLRVQRPTCLTGRQMMAVVSAAFFMPREDHLAQVVELTAALENLTDPAPKPAPTVFLVGNTCQNLAYIAAIEDAGCRVMNDELCSGVRAFNMKRIEDGETPLNLLARMYLTPAACPTKHQPGHDIAAMVQDAAKQGGADGVMIFVTKFCEPWGFEYPHLRETLEAAGVPVVQVEIECHQPPGEPFRNRVAAFVEMLENKV